MVLTMMCHSNLLFETCPQGRQHRTKFPSSHWRVDEILGLVHSKVCGKKQMKNLSVGLNISCRLLMTRPNMGGSIPYEPKMRFMRSFVSGNPWSN